MAKSKSSKNTASPITITRIEAVGGDVGILTLNSEKTLNSLSIEMVKILTQTLNEWADDEAIKAIVLRGSGEKAFCAGGDVQALYHSSTNKVDGIAVDAEIFFLEEYKLDYLIHCYDKPIICLAHGVVMGGGLGLMSGASHRIVTDTTYMAMPEITIGLFPDVGGTYFLNQIPYNIGYFLALTGAPFNASDALFCDLAEFSMLDSDIERFLEKLSELSFTTDHQDNHSVISDYINIYTPPKGTLSASEIKRNLPALEEACAHNSLCKIVESINQFDDDNPFLSKAKRTLNSGSPLSLLIIYEQLKRHRYLDLQSVFKSELILASNIVRGSEFSEGVRALLIDKDRSPNWHHSHYSSIPCTEIEAHFSAPWEHNPLDAFFATS